SADTRLSRFPGNAGGNRQFSTEAVAASVRKPPARAGPLRFRRRGAMPEPVHAPVLGFRSTRPRRRGKLYHFPPPREEKFALARHEPPRLRTTAPPAPCS